MNVDGLETDLKERLRTFANLAILNQIIIIFLPTQTLDCNLILLYVIRIDLVMLRICYRNISIALITCFVLTG